MNRNANRWLLGLCAMVLVGCSGSVQPTVGGTRGRLLSGGAPLSQVQVNVYRGSGDRLELIGQGFTDADGAFELVSADASEPLVLPPGTVRFTVESIGAEVVIPTAYTAPSSTPLQVNHQQGDSVELELPAV